MMTDQDRYSFTAILLHWVMAILAITLFGLGWYMVDLPKGSDERSWFFALHKSIGLTMAILVLLRLIWRLKHVPPVLPASISKFKQKL
ncbi:MAG: cytochrome b/b6 domain-containing protein, partial [Gammaproteobacteria bacterium]|nr:cytochrome b/b6 domain-containing protein [Gammaproteobacteria bacterium]